MVTIKPLIQKTILFLVMILFLLAAGSARAGFNMYLFISDSSGTITGEVTNTGFAGQIWVTNFSWGVVNPVSSGGTVGKPVFNAFTITKTLDLASPVLMEDCAVGSPLKSVVLSFQSQAGKQILFYTISLSNGFITSVNSSGSTTDGRPLETVTLTYSTINWKYQQLDENGNPVGSPVSHGYDLSTGTGS